MTRKTSASAPASTSADAADLKPAAPGTELDSATTTSIPPDVQNGTLRFDPIGNLEPSPGYTAASPPDLAADPDYIEPRTSLNPAVILPNDTDAEPSADAVREADLPANTPFQTAVDSETADNS